MHRTLLPILFAVPAVYAAEYTAEADPMAGIYEKLYTALEQEVLALEQIDQPADAAAAVAELRAALAAQQELLSVDQNALWLYIDNTKDKKQAMVDILVRLALQFQRIEKAAYFDNAELKELLAPQVEYDSEAEHAKREKVHAVDHDED